MALKFRRGTTAQQSGSLAFGEPFVNTTLQTLLVGGDNGDIQLATVGTASVATFGDISGSGLDITGNAEIHGNLILGGNITIGDANTDTIALNADLSSSIIPDATNTFDLGSTTKVYRNVYATSISGAIAATNGVVSGSSQVLGILDSLNTFSGSQLTQNSTLATYTGSVETRLTEIGVVSGSLITSASAAKTKNDSQDVSLTNLNSYTASLQAGIQMTGSTVSFLGNIVVYGTQSVINSQNVSISDNILYLSPTASIDNDLGVVGHYNDGTYRHAGIFMDASDGHTWKVFNGLQDETSAQVDVNGTGFTLADFKAGAFTGTSFNGIHNGTINATNGVVSGSSQIIGILDSLNTYTGSNDTTNTTQNSRLDQLSTASGSAITRLNALEIETANLEAFSSSALTRLSNLEGTDISITLTGDVTGTGTITNLANVSFATTIAANSVALGTDTTGNYMSDLTAGTGVTITHTPAEGSNATIAIGQSVATSSNVQFNSLGVGMAASATAGRIDASGDIVAYSTSDRNFKENITPIPNALEKISKISGNTYDWKEDMKEYHGFEGNDVGVIAQEIEAILPQLVTTRETGYKAVKYDKLVALLIEGIKEQQTQIHSLTLEIEKLKESKGL